MLEGKRLVITGVLTKHSIAFAVAREAQELGAEVLLTSFGRARSLTQRSARQLPTPPDVVELDVTSPADFERLREEIGDRWDAVDGVLHAIAHAPPDAFGGGFLETPTSSAVAAFTVSAVSFRTLAATLAPLMEPGGSIVGLDFDASVAWPVYDWMGVAKASLESINRYLARDLGPRGIRVNLIAAGPLRTVSASGAFKDFHLVADGWSKCAPLGWDADDARPVGKAACFLLSDWSTAITGEILHVDGGFHAVGLPIAVDGPA